MTCQKCIHHTSLWRLARRTRNAVCQANYILLYLYAGPRRLSTIKSPRDDRVMRHTWRKTQRTSFENILCAAVLCIESTSSRNMRARASPESLINIYYVGMRPCLCASKIYKSSVKYYLGTRRASKDFCARVAHYHVYAICVLSEKGYMRQAKRGRPGNKVIITHIFGMMVPRC